MDDRKPALVAPGERYVAGKRLGTGRRYAGTRYAGTRYAGTRYAGKRYAGKRYAAFISYSRSARGHFAPAVQHGLQQFARPWYRRRALEVFRDATGLAVTSELWPSIRDNLDRSAWLIVLASPESARSRWVGREIEWWIEVKGPRTIMIVVTDGACAWDEAAGDFDHDASTAVHPALHGVFPSEPRYLDMTWAREDVQLTLRNASFRSAIAELAAPLHGVPKDELEGEDVRAQRRRVRVITGTVVAMAVLLVLSAVATVVAVRQRDLAESRARDALSRRAGVVSENIGDSDIGVSRLLAVAGWRIGETSDARHALLTALAAPARGEFGGGGQIERAALSPDGRVLATAGGNATVHLWDLATRRRLDPLLTGHVGVVSGVAYSPDGRMLATAGDDGAVKLWDTTTRRQVGRSLIGHKGAVYGLAFGPGGRVLASAGVDGTIRRWNVVNGGPIGVPVVNPTPVYDVAFATDGRTLAAGGDDKVVRLWDAVTGRRVGRPLSGHTGTVMRVAFSPDGRTLAGAADDGTVRLWDTTTRRPRGEPLTGHRDGTIWGVAFSPDGRTLASAGIDGTIRLWDVTTGRPLGDPLMGHVGQTTSVAFSPDGRTLASTDKAGDIRLWDVEVHRRLAQPLVGHRARIRTVAFSPDGRVLATAGDDMTIRLWDPATRRAIGTALTGHGWTVHALAFNPDGRTLASGGSDGTIRLWDLAGRRQSGPPLAEGLSTVLKLAFSPDGRTLAAVDGDSLLLYDVRTRREIGRLRAGRVFGLVFGTRLLAAAGEDGAIRFWDPATRRPLGGPVVTHSRYVHDLASSPDGRIVAAAGADGAITLWDALTHRQMGRPLSGHSGQVLRVAFSPDGGTLASTGTDGTVRFWDLATLRQVGPPMTGHGDTPLAVAFSPDGELLATVGGNGVASPARQEPVGWYGTIPEGVPDGVVFLWGSVPTADPVTRLCAMAGRDLTQAEWDLYLGDWPREPIC
ncbi:TIR domain-containing protein [Microbispora sp. NPDC049633]|uniref:TIR domain-containing protein n=1 Tax=Microbispora sp. NPDC049633 TaxID=3154355 RepID=UPI0034416DBC